MSSSMHAMLPEGLTYRLNNTIDYKCILGLWFDPLTQANDNNNYCLNLHWFL